MTTQPNNYNIVSDWVKTNEARLSDIQEQNPELSLVIDDALNYLNSYLGAKEVIKIPEKIVVKEPIVIEQEPQEQIKNKTISQYEWREFSQTNTPDRLVQIYKDYVSKKGIAVNSNEETAYNYLAISFGEITTIDNTSIEFNEFINNNFPNLNFENVFDFTIFRFVLKPEFRDIFKKFKSACFNENFDDGYIFPVLNLKLFGMILRVLLNDDLLYNTLSIPDLIKEKSTNSIVVTQEEQSEFDDLLDELDNLEL
jgi:hypothetical protein